MQLFFQLSCTKKYRAKTLSKKSSAFKVLVKLTPGLGNYLSLCFIVKDNLNWNKHREWVWTRQVMIVSHAHTSARTKASNISSHSFIFQSLSLSLSFFLSFIGHFINTLTHIHTHTHTYTHMHTHTQTYTHWHTDTYFLFYSVFHRLRQA